MKEKARVLYQYMKEHPEPISKETICQICGVNNERSAREIIAVIAERRPIIATSDCKGYRLALTESDLSDVEHSWAEIDSRIEELEKRKKPLIDFYDKTKYKQGEHTRQ